ncbi:MAG: T9SS type A sorting domain-containing protein, partial [Bacteroidales bacterium]|nr:T9SS type A sorting domain-containing protein [Bacteroidales bacterium]
EGLITSANYNAETKQIVLCGYSSLLQPFLLLLYDYQGNDFFSGNKRKINLNLPFHQVEAIAGFGNYQYYLTNEYISRYGVTIPAKFHKIDLSEFLSPETVNVLDKDKNTGHFFIYPNPAKTNLFLEGETDFSDIYIYDSCGKLVKTSNHCQQITLDDLNTGLYWLNICNNNKIVSVKHFIKE